MQPKIVKSLQFLALLAIVALVYWPGLSGRFLFDDFPSIVSNPRVHLDSLGLESLRVAAQSFPYGFSGRPLAMVSFAINHALGGTDPYGYKLASLGVHLLNATLILLLARRLLGLCWPNGSRNGLAAFAIALLWAVHPLQVSSVLYVVQRMETMALTFVLLALLTYLRGRIAQIQGARGWPWLLACLPLAALGLLCKETALLLPAFTLALEATVLSFKASNPLTARNWKWAYAIGVLLLLLVFVFKMLPASMGPSAYLERDFTLYQRLLTQLRVLVLYLSQILLPLPARLTFYYDAYPISRGWLSPVSTLLCGLFLTGLLAVALNLRKRLTLFSLGILWFFAAHVLTSNVVPLELAFEHRNYFGLFGVLLALADLSRLVPMQDGSRLKQVAVGAIILAFGFLCVLRAATWGNPMNLAMSMAQFSPLSARASNDLAEQYMILADGNAESPFYSMAVAEFERGSRLPNSSPLPEQGLILMAAIADQPVQPEWWDRFIHKLQTRPLGPQENGAVEGLLEHRSRGIQLDDQQLAKAYEVLVARSRLPTQAYLLFAQHALANLKDDALASRMYVAALEHTRDDPKYAEQLIGALISDGHHIQAHAVATRARELGLLHTEPNHL